MTSFPTTEQIKKFVHSRTVVAAADTLDFMWRAWVRGRHFSQEGNGYD
jgi:hypothetical protein